MTKPNLVIIGAQKSASTFLQNCLKDHPDIYLPHGETTYFEDPDYHDSSPLEEIIGRRSEKIVGIKRPNYLCKSEVPQRIRNELPNTKLIVVLRDPVDRLISSYYHQIKYGTFPPIKFEEGIDDIIKNGMLSKQFPRSKEIISFGFYGKNLLNYEDFIKNGNMLILFHSEILKNPLTELKKCFSFLEVNNNFIPKSLNSRPQKVIYSIKRLKWLCQRNRFLHEYNSDLTRLKIKSMSLIDYFFVGIITGIDQYCLRFLFSNEKPLINKNLKSKLFSIYKNDIELLESILNKDLSSWKH